MYVIVTVTITTNVVQSGFNNLVDRFNVALTLFQRLEIYSISEIIVTIARLKPKTLCPRSLELKSKVATSLSLRTYHLKYILNDKFIYNCHVTV